MTIGAFGLVLLVVSLVAGFWLTAAVGAITIFGQAYELRAAQRRH